jgi:VanZ family protein
MHWLFPNMPEEKVELIHHVVRKTAHFVEYAILGFLTWRAVHFDRAFGSSTVRRQCWFVVMFCMFYASTDEFHQKFVPGREPAVQDVLLDTCGASFGLLTALGFRKMRAPV